MKKQIKQVSAALLLAGLMTSGVANLSLAQEVAKAESLAAVKIGIIDLQKIQSNSALFKSMKTQGEAYAKKYQDDAAAKEKEIKKMTEDLKALQSGGDADAIKAKEEEIRTKVLKYRQEIIENQKKLEKVLFETGAKINNEDLMPIVGNIAESKGANMILNRSQVILYNPKFDITEEVIKQLDAKKSKVTVPDPSK